MRGSDITPTPSDEEAAAIVAAVEVLWPRPAVSTYDVRSRPTVWRFSGRWWHRDRRAPAERPWN